MFLGTTGVGAWGPVANPILRIGNLLSDGSAAVAPAGWQSLNGAQLSASGGKLRITAAPGSGGDVWAATASPVPVAAGTAHTLTVRVTGSGGGATGVSLRAWDGTPAGTVNWDAQARTITDTVVLPESMSSAVLAVVVWGPPGAWVEIDRAGLWAGAGGDWAMPGTPIQGLGSRTSRPNTTDRLVEVWDGAKWTPTWYDSGWRELKALVANGWTCTYFRGRRTLLEVHFLVSALDGTAATSDEVIPAAGMEALQSYSNLATLAATNTAGNRMLMARTNPGFGVVTRANWNGVNLECSRVAQNVAAPWPGPSSLPGTTVTTAP
jgi:hypothetical protein